MKPLEVLGSNVRLLRTQGPRQMSQAKVAAWMHLDPTAVLRIEKAERDVRVEEFLQLALILGVAPPSLLSPEVGETLDLNTGDHRLDADQVAAWFAGDVTAPSYVPRGARQKYGRKAEVSQRIRALLEILERVERLEGEGDDAGVAYWLLRLAGQALKYATWDYEAVTDSAWDDYLPTMSELDD